MDWLHLHDFLLCVHHARENPHHTHFYRAFFDRDGKVLWFEWLEV
jgi:hypothetical protein